MNTPRFYSMTGRADAVADTRDRIARAAMDLLLDRRYDEVTLTDIAKSAGVSHQTVLNHFESKEGVARAASDIIASSTSDARARATPGDLDGAIRVLVGEYERIGDANARWGMDAERLGSLAPLIEQGRQQHREWIETMFGPQLPAGGRARTRVVNALFAATDVYTWKLLRRDLGLARSETQRTMLLLVHGALGQPQTP